MASHQHTSFQQALARWSAVPKILTIGGAVVAGIGLFVDPQQFGYSYLLAFMFFLSIALGSLFLVILHHLFDAAWSVPVRRINEHLAFLLPVLGILFIPIALLAKKIYPWMSINPATDHALGAKAALINVPGFYVVSVILFLVWTLLSWRLRAWSLEQDRTGAVLCTRKMRFHAAWGIFAFGFSLTLGAIFWMKSLQHQWFSTMYGVYYFAGSVWMTLVTVYVIATILKKAGPLAEVVKERQFYDLGVLFFAFTVFYAYIHFSQYFLIWNAAVPEETFWYVVREQGTWWQIGLLILFGHFLLPFLALLRIDAKLKITVMAPLAIWAWLMHFCDLSFNITPVLQIFRKAAKSGGDLAVEMTKAKPDNFVVHWMDIGCLAFIGGVLAIVFIKYFRAHAPYPQKDPRFAETMGVYLPEGSDSHAVVGGAK